MHHPILGAKPPLSYRLSHHLSRYRAVHFLSSRVAGSARGRDVFDWECIFRRDDSEEFFEATFVAPRILTRLKVKYLPGPVTRHTRIEVL